MEISANRRKSAEKSKKMFDLFSRSINIRTQWRCDRLVEDADLLREYLVCN
jgi:hypothetical protein